MKSLIPVICFLFVATICAQNENTPILIDEIGKTSCEDVLARTDNLGLTLGKNRSASAYVVSYRNGIEATRLDWQIKFIHRALIGRYGNHLNVTFLKKNDNKEARTEFWLVPSGAKFSTSDAQVLLQIPFKIDKKTLFDEDDPGPCSDHVLKGFVEMLKSDMSLSGYVVNVNYPKNERARSIKYFLDFLRETDVEDRGIRIYFKRKKLMDGYLFGYTEYWLTPSVR